MAVQRLSLLGNAVASRQYLRDSHSIRTISVHFSCGNWCEQSAGAHNHLAPAENNNFCNRRRIFRRRMGAGSHESERGSFLQSPLDQVILFFSFPFLSWSIAYSDFHCEKWVNGSLRFGVMECFVRVYCSHSLAKFVCTSRKLKIVLQLIAYSDFQCENWVTGLRFGLLNCWLGVLVVFACEIYGRE